MQRNVLALLYDPWPKNYGSDKGWVRRITTRLRRSRFSKANPRDAEYMRTLCAETWGEAEITDPASASTPDLIRRADVIVLLYPDTIGQGFAGVERDVQRLKNEAAEMRALNGRRRDFRLSPAVLRGLRLRRWLERTMLTECLFTAAFLLITPILLVIDYATGRR